MHTRSYRYRGLVLGFFVLLVPVTAALAVSIGPTPIPFSHIAREFLSSSTGALTTSQRAIITGIRAPRAVMAAVAGFALAISGALMQGIFRNPLASPYLLGTASGASTGAAVIILAGASGSVLLPAGAFAGALFATLLVYVVARYSRASLNSTVLILAGVTVGSLFSAITSYLVFRSAGSERALDIVFWIMGGLGRAGWKGVIISAAIVLPLSLVASTLYRELNALNLGNETALRVGVAVSTVRYLVLISATLITASVVAFVGTIGFIGLVTPHAVRLLVGPDHRYVVPTAGFAGATLLILADILARTAAAPAELPVGIVTAFFGAPFFLLLIYTRRKRCPS